MNSRIALTSALIATAVLLVFRSSARKIKRPPTPKQYPIIGSFLSYFPYLRSRQYHKYFLKTQQELGPICVVDLFGEEEVAVSDPAAIKRILTSTTEFKRSDFLIKNATDFLKYPLFGMATDDIWKTHRRAIQAGMGPQFVRKAYTATVQIMDDLCRIFDEKITASSTEEIVVDIREYLSYSTLDVIMASSFSMKMDSLAKYAYSQDVETKQGDSLRAKVDEISELLIGRLIFPSVLHSFVNAGPLQAQKVTTYFNSLVDSFVAPRKQGIVHEEGDLLEILLAKTEHGEYKFSDAELKDEALSILLAGHETTANALTNVFHALCLNPHVLSRILEEIDDRLPPSAPDLSFDDVPKFHYLDNLFRETMRFYPVVTGAQRYAVKDVELMGYFFPKGTVFVTHFNGLHNDTEIWGSDVNVFNPDRFDRKNYDACWMPFSAGVHMCPGMKMAIMEAKVVLIKLLQKYSFNMVPGQNLERIDGVTMHLAHGLKLKVSKRGVV